MFEALETILINSFNSRNFFFFSKLNTAQKLADNYPILKIEGYQKTGQTTFKNWEHALKGLAERSSETRVHEWEFFLRF